MREVFAHDAVLAMGRAEDLGAPGAAITVALCGSWEHDPPCPLAPHHTAADRDGDVVHLRILFATDPSDEAEVRRRIAEALATSQLMTPSGETARWQLVADAPGEVRPEEADHARRLATN